MFTLYRYSWIPLYFAHRWPSKSLALFFLLALFDFVLLLIFLIHFVFVRSIFCVVILLCRYAELGIFSVVSVGIFSLFYLGLMDLAKVFLDPLDNENYIMHGCGSMDLSVLVRESNGSSLRWMKGAQRLPR